MKKTITFFASLIIVMLLSTSLFAQALLNEQFNYPVGDSVTAHGWTGHSGWGTNNIPVVTGNLSYTGFCTAVGQMASMATSGQDINHTFTAQSTGSVYAAALINVTSATTTGDYFFHFMASSTVLVGRVYIKRDATDITKFTLGVLKGSTVANTVYSTTLLAMNTTHLIVLKYTINSGAGDDVVSLFINPATAVEGTPTIVASDVSSTDLATVGMIGLRQGSSSNAAALNIDGIRVATNWADAIGFSGTVTAPVVTTGTTSGLTSTSAICAGNVTADGGGVISARGVCYGATVDPDITGTKVIVSGTTGAFTANLSGLTAGNTYHYRAYATNTAGTAYGADSMFTTPTGAVAPVVSTGAASAVLTTIATVGGEVINDGGSAITLRGICYGTTLNPDTTTKVVVTGTTGVYSGNLTGLTGSTLYHARAFAKNAIGLSYGADITFTTQVAGIPCANIAALRLKTADNSTIYELTAEVILSCKVSSRNQKYVQDASGAILIDDATAVISTTYNVGDGITGIKGKLENYFGLLEFHPILNTAAATSTGNTITPVTVTAVNLQDTVFMYPHQSKLIKLVAASFTDANGTMKFGTGKKFRMTQTTTTDSLFYCNFFDADYAATATAMVVPSGTGDVTGIACWSKGHCYITARNKYDISLLVGVNDVQSNKIGIYPNPSNGKFTVNTENSNSGEIKIYSIVGSLILSQQINKANNEFDLAAYGKGLYFVQFTDAKSGKSWTEKLIVK